MLILLVEDDKSIRETLQLYMCDDSQGRHCETASTLAEALLAVAKTRFDLIILDLLLQGEMSTPLISYVRHLYPENTPGICVISAMHGAHKIAEENKVDHCIAKPFDLETIDDIVLKKKCV